MDKKTIVHEGQDYNIISQTPGNVKITTAYRTIPFNHVKIIKTTEYSTIDEVDTQKIMIHESDLKAIVLDMNKKGDEENEIRRSR